MRLSLTPEVLERAYSAGIFPMPDWTGVLRWFRPDPRAILPLDQFHASRSLQRTLRKNVFEITYDRNFEGVMQGCAGRKETWITPQFIRAYTRLHSLGKAHSVEVWLEGKLVGGTYGVHLGGAFFAESKFHTVTDASKVALAKLVERLRERNFALLEVQYLTEHLRQFGVIEIADDEYMRRLRAALALQREF